VCVCVCVWLSFGEDEQCWAGSYILEH
jgi:hypothetical protein